MIITAFVIDIAWEHQTTDPALARLLFDPSDSLALGEGEGIAGSLPGPGLFTTASPPLVLPLLDLAIYLLIGRARRQNLNSID